MVVAAPEKAARRRVLDAAAALFVVQGYAGTTLREIAAETGIKAGSIYHHFDSKDDIFVAVLADGIEVMLDAFDGTAESTDETDTNESRLHAQVQAHLSAVFENGPYTTAHVTAFFSAPSAVRSRVVPRRDEYEARWSVLFSSLFPRASAKDRQLHRLILFGAMNATAEWFDPEGPMSISELASAISHQFLAGFEGA